MKRARSPLSILLLAAVPLLAPGEALTHAAEACTASVHCPVAAVASAGPSSDVAFAAGARALVEAALPLASGTDRFHEAPISAPFTTSHWSRWARAAARVHHASLPRTIVAAGCSASSPRPPPGVI